MLNLDLTKRINIDVCYLCHGELPDCPWHIFLESGETAPVCDSCDKEYSKGPQFKAKDPILN